MSVEDCAATLDELSDALNAFVSQNCEKKAGNLAHKNCGGAIRVGFLNLFYLNEDGSLDSGSDGFGMGPKKVPYCEKCFPPDGFNHTYAFRFPIIKERPPQQSYKFTWGRESVSSRDLVGRNQES